VVTDRLARLAYDAHAVQSCNTVSCLALRSRGEPISRWQSQVLAKNNAVFLPAKGRVGPCLHLFYKFYKAV